ncbi:MAG: DUF2809 domain-containing protein [Clostridia bacterium]|nr:DUF2809 domain-containing protein [Clostridia bacterium]
MQKSRITYAILTFLLLICEVFIALFVNDDFIRPFIGDVLVVILICCFIRIFKPEGIRLLPLFVFLFAVCVEVAQYFDYAKLLGLDGNKFFSVLLGRSFSWHDLVCYGAGCYAFFAVEYAIKRQIGEIKLDVKYYRDFQGILVRKQKVALRDCYLLTFKNGWRRVKVYGGDFEIDKWYTIGHIGYTLINICPGKCDLDSERRLSGNEA